MYEFGRTTFSSFVWINGGALFSNVTLVEIEMVNAGAFRLEVVNQSGRVISKGDRSNAHGGWSTFSFSGYRTGMDPPLTSGMSPYKLRLVNAASGTREVKFGRVSP